ncbi:unnamed protein product, partial [Prorocentrum cordatum]
MPATARAAAAAALAPLLLAWRCQALFFELKPGLPGNGECFKFNADLGHSFVGNYEADGPEEGIVVRMLDPDMVQLFEHKTPSGKLKHTEAKAGIYQLCFLSTIPEVQMVSFDSRFGLDDEFADDHHLFITQNHTDKVKETVMKLHARTFDIEAQQQFAITREAVHRNTAESTNARVLWWTVFEA